MADQPEDVLELDEFEQLPDDEDGNDQRDEGVDEGDAEETVVGFGEEGAAPALEADSSTIRDFRKRERELVRANRELARKVTQYEQPRQIEVGEKPTLASCEYDEQRFETEFDAWTTRKAQAERSDRDQQEAARKRDEEWQQRSVVYQADKAKLPLPDYDAAEEEVFGILSDQHKALLMLSEKPAALVYALHRDPARLEQLSKLDLARAAMMIGKLEDKVQVTKRRLPQPDTPVKGNATISGASSDRELARLEKEAARTGDRTKLANYKRKLARA